MSMMPSWGRASGLSRTVEKSCVALCHHRPTLYFIVSTVISVMAGIAADEALRYS
jgi:hypothetical protein